VITEFGGKKIHNSTELRDSVADAGIGSTVPIKIIREGKSKKLDVSINELPEKVIVPKVGKFKKAPGAAAPFDLGFTLADANPALRQQYELEDDVIKAIVVEVLPQSPAAKAGMISGDVILDVNRKEVSSAKEAYAALHKGSNTLRLVRQDGVVFVVLEAK